MVYQIIVKNIIGGSDAYIYIKPHMKDKDGHTDIIALQ